MWNWPIWKQPTVDVEIYVKLLALLLSSGFSRMILFYSVLLEDKAHKLHIPANSNPHTAQKCSPKNSAYERAHTKRSDQQEEMGKPKTFWHGQKGSTIEQAKNLKIRPRLPTKSALKNIKYTFNIYSFLVTFMLNACKKKKAKF